MCGRGRTRGKRVGGIASGGAATFALGVWTAAVVLFGRYNFNAAILVPSRPTS